MAEQPYHLGRRLVRDGMDHDHYPFSALPGRRALTWPDGARVAVVVAIAVEGSAAVPDHGQWLPPGHPAWLDVSAASLADYGSRVGFFRLAQILDDFAVPATVPVSDIVLRHAPRVAEEALRRGWELVGHGPRADFLVTSELSVEQESQTLRTSREAVTAVAGTPPRGWMGPRQSESMRTPSLAAEVGYEYLMDWGNDDQPYPMNPVSPRGALVSIPASVDLCDLLVMGDFAQTPWDFGAALTEHLEVLLADGPGGRCMTVTLHAQHSGQAFRAKYIRQFLQRARELDGVWFATGAEVVDAFRSASPIRAGMGLGADVG